MATHHPNGADSGGATTIASPIRDGVAGSSDSSGLPDWKRELIERRKNLAKTTTSPGHSHSQHSGSDSPKHSSSKPAAVQSRNAASPSGSCASAATPDSSRSHTGTPTATTTNPVTGTTSPAFNVNVSLGSSFDRVTSTAGGSKQHLLLLSSPGALADVSKFRPSAAAAEGGLSRAATATTSPVSGNQSNGRSGQQQVKNENHHNNNCSVDNNKKRNTDDAESVRSSSASSIPSAAAAGGGVLAKSGRVVKKPDLQQAAAAFGRSGSRDSGQREEAKDRKSDKMVAQEVCDSSAMEAALTMISGNGQCGSDEAAEELKYGPGIVQKLRSRFMSYTMRLNAAKNQRPSLQNMRRATSLNNLLDDDVESTRTASPLHSQPDQTLLSVNGRRDEKDSEKELIRYRHSMGETNGFTDGDTIESQCCDGLKKYQNEMLRSRQLRRGNDSLKRARSVETLRYDSKAWERDVQMTANNEQLMQVLMHENPRDVNIEERIVKARERGDPRPTRLKPFMDDTERPPPDLVKTTLMKFEATANRRGRAPSTRNGEVAAKVASYKSILEKPAILYPKPPLSPKKPVIKPRTSLTGKGAPLPANATAQQRSPSPLLIHVDMTYNKQSTPACPDRRNGPNLLASPPQTPPDLINSIGARKSAQQKHQNGGGYESPITQLTHKLKSMHLQSPATTVGGGPVAVAKAPVPSDNSAVSVGGGAAEVGGSSSSTSNSSASTATSSATSSPVPHSGSGSVTGSYYLNGGSSAGGRLELGDVSAEDCYEYRDYDDDQDQDEDEEAAVNGANRLGQVEEGEDENGEEFDDEDDDEVDKEQQAVRRINKVDLQNIGQAGTTQEFRFGNGPAATNKSHLPVVPPRTGSKAKQQQDKMRFVSSGGGVVGGGVASVKAPEQLKKNGHGSVQEIVLGNEALQETNVDDCKTTTALLIKQIKEEARKTTTTTTGGRDNLNQVGVVNSSAVLGHKGGSLNSSGSGPNQNANSLNNSNLGSAGVRGNGNSDTRQALSNREIEKNLINVGKSVELKEQQQQQQLTTGVQPARKKSWQEEPQTNTMVFNFSQRKDVPDYIDSDGMILLPHRKRELPKPGESGFVVLGDLSLETSTDPDDSWTMGPPSPCNIEFENDNVIIEGKSNLRKQLNRSKWNIRFDDSLTSTFEYISESSYLEAYDDDVDSSSDSQLSSGGRSSSSNGGFFGDGQGAKFMTISSAPLGSYMPMKGSLANSFELGVTKSPSPGSSVSMSPSPTQSKEEDAAAATKGEGLANGNGTGAAGDPESLQYLKPATDPVAWSEGTRATDLLF